MPSSGIMSYDHNNSNESLTALFIFPRLLYMYDLINHSHLLSTLRDELKRQLRIFFPCNTHPFFGKEFKQTWPCKSRKKSLFVNASAALSNFRPMASSPAPLAVSWLSIVWNSNVIFFSWKGVDAPVHSQSCSTIELIELWLIWAAAYRNGLPPALCPVNKGSDNTYVVLLHLPGKIQKKSKYEQHFKLLIMKWTRFRNIELYNKTFMQFSHCTV